MRSLLASLHRSSAAVQGVCSSKISLAPTVRFLTAKVSPATTARQAQFARKVVTIWRCNDALHRSCYRKADSAPTLRTHGSLASKRPLPRTTFGQEKSPLNRGVWFWTYLRSMRQASHRILRRARKTMPPLSPACVRAKRARQFGMFTFDLS